jgi:hypothetical protein
MASNKHPVGTELGYCHQGVEHYAVVSEVHPEDHAQAGEPKGIAVYDTLLDAAGKVVGRNINHGTTEMRPMASPTDRTVHGCFWKRV